MDRNQLKNKIKEIIREEGGKLNENPLAALGLTGAAMTGLGLIGKNRTTYGRERGIPDYLQHKEGWIPDYLQGKEGWIPDYFQNRPLPSPQPSPQNEEKSQPGAYSQTIPGSKKDYWMSDEEMAHAADTEAAQKHKALRDFVNSIYDKAPPRGHSSLKSDMWDMRHSLESPHSDTSVDIKTDYGMHPNTVIDQGGYSTEYTPTMWDIMKQKITQEDLEEMNSTASVGGEYMTPMAFDPKKKKKKIKEELEPKDVQHVRKIVKGIINDMFRDIWLKRNSWNR